MTLNWSFRGRLHNTTDAMKQRYRILCGHLSSFADVKISESWDKLRVHKGRKTYCLLGFRGQTLCAALALDAERYTDSKYVYDDMSDVAKFAATPFLTRLTSERQLDYLIELLPTLFDGLEQSQVVVSDEEIPYYTQDQLIAMGLIKVSGEVADQAPEAEQPVALPAQPEQVEQPNLPTEELPQPVAEEEQPKEQILQQPQPDEEQDIAPAAEVEEVETEADVEQIESADVDDEQHEELPDIPKKEGKKHFAARKVRANKKAVVNLSLLETYFEANCVVTVPALVARGIVASNVATVKVLGGGTVSKPLFVVVHEYSRTAEEAIVAAGGRAELANK